MSDLLHPVAVTGVILVEGRVLLCRTEEAEWELPGGHLREGETPEQCLVRAIAEETGLTIAASSLLDCWCRLPKAELSQEVVVTYLCDWDGTGDAQVGPEHEAIGWFAVWDLAVLALPAGYHRAIRRALDGAALDGAG